MVNKVIRTISDQLIFFNEKISCVKKRKSNQNQPTKQNQVNNKQQRQQIFEYKSFYVRQNWFLLF